MPFILNRQITGKNYTKTRSVTIHMSQVTHSVAKELPTKSNLQVALNLVVVSLPPAHTY